MNKTTNALLDVAVKKSLKYNPIQNAKWSIVECAHNDFLAPDFDVFQELKDKLALRTFIENYKKNQEAQK